jgi:hypothetical protein
MFALDAKTGKIAWEFFLVPRVEGDAIRGPVFLRILLLLRHPWWLRNQTRTSLSGEI